MTAPVDPAASVETPVTETPGNGEAAPVETPTVEDSKKSDFKVVDSQEALDRIIESRLARERQKYANYDELSDKAKKLDEIEREKLGDIEKRDAEISELKAIVEELRGDISKREFESLRSQVAKAKGIPDHLVSRLRGETQEELESDAEELAEAIKPKKAPGERPDPVGGGAGLSTETAGFDPKSLADELRGRY